MLRLRRFLLALLAIGAVAPAAPAAAQAATSRPDGHFTLDVRVVKAVNISGRRAGQRLTRTLTIRRSCRRRGCRRTFILGGGTSSVGPRALRRRGAGYVGRQRIQRRCRSNHGSRGRQVTSRTLRVRVTSTVWRGRKRVAGRVEGTVRTRVSGCRRRGLESWVFVSRMGTASGSRLQDAPPVPAAPTAPAGPSAPSAPSTPAARPAGPVVYQDSFERDDIGRGWGALQQVPSDHAARTSSAHVRDGERSARFEVRDGDIAESGADERQQLSDARRPDGSSFRPKEGDDLHIAISLWFEPGFPFVEGDAAWQVYLPFVSFDGRGSGPAKLGSGGNLRFEGVDDVPWLDDRLAATGGWHDFVLHMRFSGLPQVGLVEIWHRTPADSDYVKQTLANGQQTQRFATLLEPSAYLKLGIYRDGRFTRTGVLHVDRLKVGQSFESVALTPGA